jgi:O-antigen/teichoic acid export membrane protein
LKINILANYISQFYVTLIGIIMLPLYIKYMGAEAYGLVGFYAMLQAWFSLLDMGLTPTMARETARFRGGALDPRMYRQFVRALEGIFIGVALIGGTIFYLSSEYIASSWLKASTLDLGQLQISIQIMALIIAMRWMCGLYRGAISGSEQLVWLGGYNSFIATIRFVGVLPVLILIDATPVTFFSFQLSVAALEMVGLVYHSYRHFPSIPRGERIKWSWAPLKPVLKFSLTIAFTSSVWVLITQTDKLVLSAILPLADYGYFTLAVLIASGVLVVGGPVGMAIMPRMARLEAEGAHAQLIRIYRQSTQLVAVVAGSASITLIFYAEPLLWAWTGDALLASQVAPMLKLYAVGNGVLAVSAFPYYLQYAKGDLRLHLIGNSVFVVFLIPLVVWAASHYGGIGAGYVWLAMNLLVFVVWLPFVHRKFEPGLNALWYRKDTMIIFASALLAGYFFSQVLPIASGRVWVAGQILTVGVLIFLAAMLASSEVWVIGKFWIRKFQVK